MRAGIKHTNNSKKFWKGDLFIMIKTMKREMNIAAEMHYELNASDFARDFYAEGNGHDDNRGLARIGLSGD